MIDEVDDAADAVAQAAEDALLEEGAEDQEDAEESEESEEKPEPAAPDLSALTPEQIYALRPDLRPAEAPKPEEKAEEPDKYAADIEAIAYEQDFVKQERMRVDLAARMQQDRQHEQQQQYIVDHRPVFEEDILKDAAGDDEEVRTKIKGILGTLNAEAVATVRHDPAQIELMKLVADGMRYRKASEDEARTGPSARPEGAGGRAPAKNAEQAAAIEMLREMGYSEEDARKEVRSLKEFA